jgi:hypothetical protein
MTKYVCNAYIIIKIGIFGLMEHCLWLYVCVLCLNYYNHCHGNTIKVFSTL